MIMADIIVFSAINYEEFYRPYAVADYQGMAAAGCFDKDMFHETLVAAFQIKET
jgi:hypothetical protein